MSTPVGPPVTEEERIALSRARSRILQARNNLESRRYDFVGPPLDEALTILTPVLAAEADPLRAEIDELRARLVAAEREEQTTAQTAELERLIATAEGKIRSHSSAAPEAIAQVEARLESQAFATYPAAPRAAMTTRIADLREQLAQAATAGAVGLAASPLRQLEEVLAIPPTELVTQLRARDSDDVEARLRAFAARTALALAPASQRAPEVVAMRAKLRAAEERIDRATLVWNTPTRPAVVFSGWPAIEGAIAGWEQEQTRDTTPLASPDLPRTRMAIARISGLLATDEVLRARAAHPNADRAYGNLELVRDEAAVKLHAAFEVSAAAGEQLPAPLDPRTRAAATILAYDAETALAGTPFGAAMAARLRALDARWRDEAELVTGQQRALCDRLAREADAAWPAIRARLNPQPLSGAVGAALEVRGFNRAGWDYGGPDHPIDFALRVDGYIVAMTYAPHVRNVLDHAAYYDKVELPSRVPWDVIAIVEGPGEVGLRTRVTFVDEATQLPLASYEQWLPVTCVRAYAVAVHAGPVAIGPA